MPYVIYDVEAAQDSGNNDHPVSTLRKLGCKQAEIVGGHEAIGVVRVYVDIINFQLPEFVSVDTEAPQKIIKIVQKAAKSPSCAKKL